MEETWQSQVNRAVQQAIEAKFDDKEVDKILETFTSQRIRALASDSIVRLKWFRDNNREKYRQIINRIRSANV